MIVVGLNAYHGDVSAVLVRDGQLIAAVEEERFRRIKHCAGFPHRALASCLAMAGVAAADVDCFAISRNPRAHLWRKALFLATKRPKRTVGDRARNLLKLRSIPDTIADSLAIDPRAVRRRLVAVEHHPAHLASAAYVSPFDDAAVCAIDGFGDFVSTSWGVVEGNRVKGVGAVYFPHSLGLMYLAITQHLGFMKYGDEFKVMGLAPYGEPRFKKEISELVRVHEQGTFELDLSYFSHWSGGVDMTWDDGEPTIGRVFTPKLEALLGPARQAAEPVDARHEAIAASLQSVFEDAVMTLLSHVRTATGKTRLCLAGGCAMNSVANGQVRARSGFREVYIQPAAGDSGTALGAAFEAWHRRSGAPRDFVMRHAYWGPEFSDAQIAAALDGAAREIGALRMQPSSCSSATMWSAGRRNKLPTVESWGGIRAAWSGARGRWATAASLRIRGARDMRDIINTRIKFRERFRPFAPSVLEEAVDEYFVDAARRSVHAAGLSNPP